PTGPGRLPATMPTATDEDPACPSGAEADSWIRRGTPCATRSSWEAPYVAARNQTAAQPVPE
ncbi:MAG: hypothetical protein ACKORB_05340, partial [Opitutia bacterium]